MNQVEITTRDGSCRTYVFHPAGDGPWPGVLVFMDGVGIRPALFELGERIASDGYYVLLPDLFYRSGPYEPMNPNTLFSDPEQRKMLSEKFMGPASIANVMSDTKYFLDYMAAQPNVRPGPIATTGYCMGGVMSLSAAGTYPDRIALAASFHAGRLVTDEPDSPHLLAPKMRARVFVAGAIEDQGFTDEMKAKLDDSLAKAGVDYAVETYSARHGWVFRDMPVYDEAQSERHYRELHALLDETLASAR